MTECPNAGHCACPEHSLGLAAYAPDVTAYLKVLHAADRDRVRRLAAVPMVETVNTYHGDRPQPWDVRPARQRAA